MYLDFYDIIEPLKSSFIKIIIPEEKIYKIKNFVQSVIKQKLNEKGHKIDNRNEYKRWYTGFIGEVAIEELLKVEFIDWSIGHSRRYNLPDLNSIGLNIGIKTVEYGKFPIIHKIVKREEIINLKTSENIILMCGLATKEILNKCQDDNLILSSFLRSKGTKTGFYGFKHLIKFKSIEELKNHNLCSP